jgi:hypothetical protein
MRVRIFRLTLIVCLAMVPLSLRAQVLGAKTAVPVLAAQGYGNLPLSFEANEGQSDERVKFLSRGRVIADRITP